MSVRMMSSELDSPKERLMLLLCVLFGHALLLGLLVVQRANTAPKPLEIELALSASEPAQTLPPLAAKPTLSPIPVLTPKATPAATSPPAPSPPAAVPTQSHTELAASTVPQNVVVSQTTTTVLPNADAAYLTNPKPSYPPLSRRLGEQGIVMLNVLVGEDGNVQKLEVAKSSGSTRLDEAASRAVQSWRFAPGKRAGIAQTMWVKVPISFILEK
jgi:protein TonB